MFKNKNTLQMLQMLPILLFSLFLIMLIVYYSRQISEGYISGAEVQLLTSKPYYTWYDYITHSRKHPYFYRYPYYSKRYYYNRSPYYYYPHFSPQFY